MTVWQNLLIVSAGNIVFFLLQLLYFRYRKHEKIPDELHKEIRQLGKDLVAVRGRVLYIEGRLNGKNWMKD